jgi:hypothetical protein
LAFPDDLSGQHILATRHDISSSLSDYIKKDDDGNLDLNDISCRSILVSAEAETGDDGIFHNSNIVVETPRSEARMALSCKEQEDGSYESSSRFLLKNGENDVFYFETGRYAGESQNPEETGISVDVGRSYVLA